jgi:hypothetical protein
LKFDRTSLDGGVDCLSVKNAEVRRGFGNAFRELKQIVAAEAPEPLHNLGQSLPEIIDSSATIVAVLNHTSQRLGDVISQWITELT